MGPIFLGVKQLGHETNHLPPPKAGVKNQSCTSSLMMWCFLSNFTFQKIKKKFFNFAAYVEVVVYVNYKQLIF
jgi:hypothetical protein